MAVIACYCRVSTEDQPLDRQCGRTAQYAEETLGVGLDELTYYEDKSTGTSTDRSDFQELLADAKAGAVDTVVVNSVSRIAHSIRDLDEMVDHLQANDVGLHIISENLIFEPGEDEDPYQRAMLQLLGVFAELEASITRQRVQEGIDSRMNADEEYHHGRAPFGFESEDRKLYQTEQYDQIVATLELVHDDCLPKRKAAKELGTSRATIDRALDRAELYGLRTRFCASISNSELFLIS